MSLSKTLVRYNIGTHKTQHMILFGCLLFSNIVQEINYPGKIINRLLSTKLLVCGQPHTHTCTVFSPNGGTMALPQSLVLLPPPFDCKVNTRKTVLYTVYKTSCTTDALLHP